MHFLVMIPIFVALIALMIGGYLYFDLNQGHYLLTPEKNKRWLTINIILFFISGFQWCVNVFKQCNLNKAFSLRFTQYKNHQLSHKIQSLSRHSMIKYFN